MDNELEKEKVYERDYDENGVWKETILSKSEIYFIECPKCNKILKHRVYSTLIFNFKIHWNTQHIPPKPTIKDDKFKDFNL